MSKRTSAGQQLGPGGTFRRTTGHIIVIAVAIVGLIAGLQAPGVGMAQNNTLVRCNPATAVGVMGQPLDVDIYVENVVDLWAVDIRLSFDTSVIKIVDADPNADGVQITPLDDFLSPDFVVRRNGDNAVGTILYVATQVKTPENPANPVSGSGPLARVTFQPLQAGTFTMPITYQKLVHTNGTQIAATAIDCKITFIEIDDLDQLTYLPVAFSQNQ